MYVEPLGNDIPVTNMYVVSAERYSQVFWESTPRNWITETAFFLRNNFPKKFINFHMNLDENKIYTKIIEINATHNFIVDKFSIWKTV
jgi:hypothetical protein